LFYLILITIIINKIDWGLSIPSLKEVFVRKKGLRCFGESGLLATNLKKYVLGVQQVEPIEWRGKIRNCDGRRVEWGHRLSQDVGQNDVLINTGGG